MPSVESLAPVLESVETDYMINSDAVTFRQNDAFGQLNVYNIVKFFFGDHAKDALDTSSVDAFRRATHMSMVVQSSCIRAETEHYRRGRDSSAKTGGALYWMLNDVWPAPSWSSIEYGGRRKLLHYEAKRFYAPVAVSSFCSPSIGSCSSVSVVVASDRLSAVTGWLCVSVVRWKDGVETHTAAARKLLTVAGQGAATLSLNSSEFAALLTAGGCTNSTGQPHNAACFITSRFTAQTTGELVAPVTHQWLSYWRDAELQPAKLTLTTTNAGAAGDGRVAVTVSTDAVAPNVMVHCGQASDFGWFDDNAFMLMPGANKTVTYTPRAGPIGTDAHHTPCTASGGSFYVVSVNGLSEETPLRQV
jgi:beta-mannosidase